LVLDSRNPRIVPSEALDPKELIKQLIDHEGVLELVRSISSTGYLPNEPVVAVKERGKMVVVEGNRRVAACKLLLDPSLAPEAMQDRVRTLAGSVDKKAITKVPTIVAPTRESTTHLLIARHTRSLHRDWAPFMQASFYKQFLGEHVTVDELAHELHVSPAELRKSIQLYEMYSIACRLKLPSEIAEIVRNPLRFEVSNISRIYENTKAREFLGLSFTEEGKVDGKLSKPEFEKLYAVIVADLARKVINSRDLNTSDQIEAYLAKIENVVKPDRSKPGRFDLAAFPERKARTPKPMAPAPKPRQPVRQYRGVVPPDVKCYAGNSIVADAWRELQRLPLKDYPRAGGLLLRTFLELAVSHFMRSNGEVAKMQAEESVAMAKKVPPQKLAKDWSPTLSKMLNRIASTNAIIADGKITKPLKAFIASDLYFLLNLLTHNETVPATEERVRNAWKACESFVKYIISIP
jgi:hypothetical protein